MRCYVITGVSRGLGLALAEKAASRGAHVIGIARTVSAENNALAAQADSYRSIQLDLADTEAVSDVADELFSSLAALQWQGVYLINNAGSVEPIAPAGDYADDDAALSLATNLMAPIQLTNAFIRHFAGQEIDKRVLNISSGAGRNAYEGWSVYCAGKAGLDHYTRCVGLEQADRDDGVKIASIAPGIIDTAMQAAIRMTSAEQFPLLQQFRDYHAHGDLASPAAVAARLLDYLHGDAIGFGDVTHIRETS